ncbi:hypothetical protein [Bacillus testis]|uniref:hypothetical protein n=1 Tax=Bacillus testis TaxID=1622072 RepID=UPI00067E7478|nr:hypothetical protein [Bacillus testis]
MKQVMNSTTKAKEYEKKRATVLRMELDYELATLYEAITEKNKEQQKESKAKLEKIRRELIKLQAL